LALAQACAELLPATPIKLAVVTTAVHEVTGAESLQPGGALAAGLAGVIGRELPNVTAWAVDRLPAGAVAAAVIAEFARPTAGASVALRGKFRWVRHFEPAPQCLAGAASKLRRRGVYLITGGTGGIGAALAVDLAQRWQARLVVLSRRGGAPELADAIAAAGGEAMIERCDVADPEDLRRVVAAAQRRFDTTREIRQGAARRAASREGVASPGAR